jgi:hypothetical protein
MKTLTDLIGQSGIDVLAHLARDLEIPVLAGVQAQGDVIVLPLGDRRFENEVRVQEAARWLEVPSAGVEVLRGMHPHVIVADPAACRWTTDVLDPSDLALGVLEAAAPVHLLHPEHGAAGIAPGRYLLRRQREQRQIVRAVSD